MTYTHWCLWGKELVSVTQWQWSTFKKSFTFSNDLFISLLFKLCFCVKNFIMNWFVFINFVQQFYHVWALYLRDFFQYQQTDSSSFVLDVNLTELMSVYCNRADFLNCVLITYSMKEVVDSVCRKLPECMIKIDVHHFAVSEKKCCWLIKGTKWV